MNTPIKQGPNFLALLIGIDCYLENRLPGGGCYPSLGGCVRDIEHLEKFLLQRLGLPKERINKLTATNTESKRPAEAQEHWPTYENMVKAFKKVIGEGRPGDQVYIHYSGHGGRAKTAFPALKGSQGLDETLVPTDIGFSEAQYLRDVEMAHFLRTMVDKNLLVTVVLDSCHSGGATRGEGGAAIRGVNFIDLSSRPADSLVARPEELAFTWRALSGGATRALKPGGGWLLEPKGYVLMSACRASESANEYPFNGRERNGALTYWMLDGLRQMGPGMTYKALHDLILTKVHSQFPEQTPQLQGEGNRVVFGSDRVPPYYAVPVMKVDSSTRTVLLNAGQAHGIRKRAQFAIYPPGVIDVTQKDSCQAVVEVTEPGATDSWAKIREELRKEPVKQGAQAVLLDLGTVKLQRAVRVFIEDPMKKTEVEKAVKEGGCGFVRLSAGDEPPDFQVGISGERSGEYEIWDPAGNTIRNLRPGIRISDVDAATRIVRRLVHLAKYRNVQELSNQDPMSPLANKLAIDLLGVQRDYDPGDKPEPQPFGGSGNTPSVQTGEWIFLRIRNKLLPGAANDPSRILNVTVLDLQPNWGIMQIYPASAGYFEPLDPGKEILLPLRASLPDSYAQGADILKVLATLGTTNFRWLELPPLDRPPTEGMIARSQRGPEGALERLFAAVTTVEPKTRDLDPARYPSREWSTAQVEVCIQK